MKEIPKKTFYDYALEKVSPIVSFVLILFPILASFISPAAVAIFLIIMYIYFFYKSASLAVFFALAVSRIRRVNLIDWNKLLNGLGDIDKELQKLIATREKVKRFTWADYQKESIEIYEKFNPRDKNYKKLPLIARRLLFSIERRKALGVIKEEALLLEELKTRKNYIKPSELQHIIIIPHVKEPKSLLRETVEQLAKQTFNTKQINVVLAAEAADPNGVKVSQEIKEEFKGVFNNFWITNHVLQPYDAVGKSANMNWAGMEIYQKIKKLGWDLKKTTITSCDADSKFDLQHFAYLSHLYCTHIDSEYKFYNGAMMFYNNIWRLPFYARVKNSLNSIYNVANLVRTDKLVPFSTYTCSYWLMEEIDFWDPWVTPEDYHIFFKALFKHNERVSTIPMFIRILSDAAEGEGHWDTIQNNYKQTRRWSWGVSDDGWMLKHFFAGFFTHSLRAKYVTLHALFDHIIGFPLAILIMIGGVLPGLINPNFTNEVSGALFPIVSGNIVSYTVIFFVSIIVIDYLFKPKPEYLTFRQKVQSLAEWIIQPITTIVFAAIPSFDAQMRLVLGKYMEYYVTKKKGDGEKEDS